jgi:glycine/D-amino acid oxidase-like deaminating enzyme
MAHPDIDGNHSAWAAAEPAPEPFAALTGENSADVCIIGAGFTGMSTAYHMAKRFPDRRIIVLEARRIANGASGRNGGLMLNWVNGVEPGDPVRAKTIFDATKEGIDLIEGIIRDNGLSVRWRRDGSMHVHTRQKGADEAQKEVEGLRSVGLPLRFVNGAELPEILRLKGAVGAVIDPTAGHLDGVSYLRALAPALVKLGVGLYEESPVVRIEEGAECLVHTPSGVVRSKAIVLATNAYTPRLGYFADRIFPLHAHVIATEGRSPEEWAKRGWSAHTAGYRYGGRTSWEGAVDFDAVHRRLLQYMPDISDIPLAHRWTGPVALSWNRICAMGVRGDHKNVYYALGYSGHGVTLANLAGRVLCDLYAGADERWRGLPFYKGPMAWMPPEPFRWIGYHVVTRLTGKSPRKRGVKT